VKNTEREISSLEYEDNIEKDFKGLCCRDMDWINQWLNRITNTMDFRV